MHPRISERRMKVSSAQMDELDRHLANALNVVRSTFLSCDIFTTRGPVLARDIDVIINSLANISANEGGGIEIRVTIITMLNSVCKELDIIKNAAVEFADAQRRGQ